MKIQLELKKNLFVSQSEAESVIDDIGKGLDTLTDSTDNTLQSKLQGIIEKVDKVLGGIIVSFITEIDVFLRNLFLNLQKSIVIK